MGPQEVDTWLEGYLRAWDSNDPADIGRLFTEGARYYTAPYREPWKGQEGIIAGWLGRKDEPGEYTFRYEILGIDGQTAFVRGWTRYHEGPIDFSNLWVIRLNAQGACDEFIEWWMEQKD